MNPELSKDLAAEDQSPFHKQMLEECKKLVKMSRDKMGQNYDTWDRNDEIYRGIRKLDAQDKKAIERKEPEKMVVPVSYSQVQTFVAFCYALYTQRERFFELLGMSEEDHKAAKIGEAFLQRDLTYNIFEQKLYQWLLDISRFGIGIVKTGWVRETQKAKSFVQKPGFSFFGLQIGGGMEEVEQVVTKHLGNRIWSVSPYRFFPDTRLPISRFQEGEFCASEDEYSWTTLKKMEKDGQVQGISFLKPLSKKDLQDRGASRLSSDIGGPLIDTGTLESAQSRGTVIVTEVQRVIVPSEYMVDGKPLGPEDYPVKYNVWLANDQRVIKCEPLGYMHDEFTYDCAQLSPDQHATLNQSLCDMVDSLQNVISWFINSRITSVRKVVSNMLVVDPEGIEMKDLENRNPVIRLKAQAGSRGIDRWIKQLKVDDVTSNHINDVQFLQTMIEVVTGINQNMLGQFHTGRRSAQEARNSFSSAAQRLKMIASIIYRTGIEPMGRKMLSNLRDGLDEETMVRIVGIEKTVGDQGAFLPYDKTALAGNYDFELFDATLPSEKGVLAQTLEQLLLGLMRNPEAAISLGIDVKALLMESLELRGVRNPERFTLRMPPQGFAPGTGDNQPEPQVIDGGLAEEGGEQEGGFSGLVG